MTSIPTHSINQRSAAGTAIAFAAQMIGQAARAIAAARLLEPAEFGRFLVVRGLAAVASLVAQGGLGTVGLRHGSAALADGRSPRGTSTRVMLLATLGGLAAGLLFALAARLTGASTLASASWGVLVCSSALTTVVAGVGRGLVSTEQAAALERGLPLPLEAAALATLFLVRGTASLDAAALVVAAASLIPLVLVGSRVWFALRSHRRSEGHSPAALMQQGWPVAAQTLASRALADADLWIVAAVAGPASAATYGVASRLAILLQTPAAVANYVAASPIAAFHTTNRLDAVEHHGRRAARFVAAGTALGYASLLVAGGSGIAVVFGDAYRGAAALFAILGAGQLAASCFGPAATALLMIGAERTVLWITLVSAMVTAASVLALVGWLGAAGAAIAAASGLVFQHICLARAVRRHLNITLHV